jgi:hypothetical protein
MTIAIDRHLAAHRACGVFKDKSLSFHARFCGPNAGVTLRRDTGRKRKKRNQKH